MTCFIIHHGNITKKVYEKPTLVSIALHINTKVESKNQPFGGQQRKLLVAAIAIEVETLMQWNFVKEKSLWKLESMSFKLLCLKIFGLRDCRFQSLEERKSLIRSLRFSQRIMIFGGLDRLSSIKHSCLINLR